MNGFEQFLPAHIRKLVESHEARVSKLGAREDRAIALHLNENPFGPSPLALQAIEHGLAELHRYPEAEAADLTSNIARFHGVPAGQVLVTAGLTELLGMIARALLGPELKAITSARSFMVYRLATKATPGSLIEVETRDDGYDLEAIEKAVDQNTRIVFVANPNNPTGSLIAADALAHFINRLPQHVLLVLDEAYGDYAEYFADKRGVAYPRSLEYLRDGRNIILLRTFSKVHGLAGLRVGYGIGPEALITVLRLLRTMFSVSALAEAAASAALHDREHIRTAIENNAEQAAVVSGGLERLGLKALPTWANFIYCETGQSAARFADELNQRGILVQPLGSWGADTAIRVSIGTPEDNGRFLEALAKIRRGHG
ncbi:MAG: histidinol-phosphate transaminase [Acidobacteria bacterium]|nr:histidinol-phosphate transaminase [Acidobacteriota bacterium]